MSIYNSVENSINRKLMRVPRTTSRFIKRKSPPNDIVSSHCAADIKLNVEVGANDRLIAATG